MLSCRIQPDLAPPPPIDRALAAITDLRARRAVLRERLTRPGGAQAFDLVLRRAVAGAGGAHEAAVALASLLIAFRRDGEVEAIGTLRREAEAEGLAAVAALLVDAPAHRALAPRGKLREVCIRERAPLLSITPAMEASLTMQWRTLLRRKALASGLTTHPSPILARRLLEAPWLPLDAALSIAARRPTSAAIAFEIAGHDRWIAELPVREAMAQNPFTPTGIVLALLPSIGGRLIQHLRDAGDAHPRVAEAAALLLALRG